MERIISEYKRHIKNVPFWLSLATSLIMLAASFLINFLAGTYATERISNPVTDIILSNTRVYDVDGIFIYGALALVALIIILCFLNPKKSPFTIKAVALFVLIRALFVTLTHIAPFPTHASISPTSLIDKFSFGGDLFFSGHTGLPFLMSLIYWNNRPLRMLFFALSLLFGAVVLLAHLHYTIDVMSAFFITYSIYHIACFFFKEDKRLADQVHPVA